MDKFDRLEGVAAPLPMINVDTDKVIPARFLKTIKRTGLGINLFRDLRFNPDGSEKPEFVLNKPAYRKARFLIAGENFGCGSSREHAPQALMRWGVQAVVAESFAEIFFGNCTSLGIPAVTTSRENLKKLAAAIQADPQTEITVNLQKLEVRFDGETMPCDMPASARSALVSGQWDFLSQLLAAKPQIRETAAAIPYMSHFAV
jgi:3-isopropylmalate/(R)-2-methylmalate dehydratase small subunit